MNGSVTLGVLVVALLGAASAALCGYDIQQRRFALAGFLAFVALFDLAVSVSLITGVSS